MMVDAAVFDDCNVEKAVQTPSIMDRLIGTLRQGTALIQTARKEAREIDPALAAHSPL
jgi:hypothetical protein